VESEPGKGSTFIIYLPASCEPVSTNEIKPETHKGSGTIIVIDDEDSVSIILKKMLEKVGYTVECKSDGRQGVDFYIEETKGNKRIVSIITDLTIPGGMGGVEVVSEIRKLNKDIPIFVVSGYADDSAIIAPGKYGFTDSISKPFTLTDLLGMLDKYLI
jgi:CheY-like chemotaxis protein